MNTDYCYVNIVLHGMFFMEFSGGKLIVKAPDVKMHRYCSSTGSNLVEMPCKSKPLDIDLTAGSLAGLKKGSITSFENFPMIPQFSKKETGVGNLNSSHQMSLILEQPDNIIPLRMGLLDDFEQSTKKGTVRDSILKQCSHANNEQLALVTCLRYEKSRPFGAPPTTTLSFYAEHEHNPEPSDMNDAYGECQKLFTNGKAFNLELIDPPTHVPPPVPPDVHPGYGVSDDDELSLSELLREPQDWESAEAIHVANCIQFAVTS